MDFIDPRSSPADDLEFKELEVEFLSALQSLEEKLASLTSAFGPLEEAQPAKPEGDAALLNGPQLEKSAASQTDIDALFASLG